MKILYGYKNVGDCLKDAVIAIGMFDGVHVGHKRVIKRVLNAPLAGATRAVMTFDPHPQNFFSPGNPQARIMSLEHRLNIFRKMGLDAAVVIRFTEHIAGMSPEDFIRKVLCRTGVKRVYVGGNFHFGRGKSGNVETFRREGKVYGIDVRTVQPVKLRGRTVSSTWLRALISSGKIEQAARLLRRSVSVYGTVVAGDKRGRLLGVPTANIDPHHEVMPPPGTYAVRVDVDGNMFKGVLNTGFNPTFYGRGARKRMEPRIETHLIGFDGDLYGHSLEIFFIKKLRREKHFRNAETLQKQIIKDIERAEALPE